jgi:hypothetical protein
MTDARGTPSTVGYCTVPKNTETSLPFLWSTLSSPGRSRKAAALRIGDKGASRGAEFVIYGRSNNTTLPRILVTVRLGWSNSKRKKETSSARSSRKSSEGHVRGSPTRGGRGTNTGAFWRTRFAAVLLAVAANSGCILLMCPRTPVDLQSLSQWGQRSKEHRSTALSEFMHSLCRRVGCM